MVDERTHLIVKLITALLLLAPLVYFVAPLLPCPIPDCAPYPPSVVGVHGPAGPGGMPSAVLPACTQGPAATVELAQLDTSKRGYDPVVAWQLKRESGNDRILSCVIGRPATGYQETMPLSPQVAERLLHAGPDSYQFGVTVTFADGIRDGLLIGTAIGPDEWRFAMPPPWGDSERYPQTYDTFSAQSMSSPVCGGPVHIATSAFLCLVAWCVVVVLSFIAYVIWRNRRRHRLAATPAAPTAH